MVSAQAAETPCTHTQLIVPGSLHGGFYTPSRSDQPFREQPFYGNPGHIFWTGQTAAAFVQHYLLASSTRFEQDRNFVEPFNDSRVRLSQGWVYNEGDFHVGVDYSRFDLSPGEDPSFTLFPIADGTVVYVGWLDAGYGNTVIIEHMGASGQIYRSIYAHLRNGADQDRAEAIRSSDDESPYRKYVESGDVTGFRWGSNADRIQVHVGEWVSRSTVLGSAGSTGEGGVSRALNEDGTLRSNQYGTENIHLHFALAVPAPEQNKWMMIDPYGVYQSQESGCYRRGGVFPELFQSPTGPRN